MVRELDGDTVAAYSLLADIYGSPALVLRVDEPRDIHAQGQQAVRFTLYLLLGSGLISSVLIIIGVDRLVLRRVRRLRAGIEAVAASHNVSERVAIGGRDELAAMADSINRTLASLEQSHRDLVETEARNRALIEAIPDLMFRVNRNGEIVEGSWPLKTKSAAGNGGPDSRDMPEEFMDQLPAQIQQIGLPHIAEALDTRETQVFEFQPSPDAGSPQYEARVVPGGSNDVLIMVRDVTERKHEEEARQKSLLLKEIHHRVKNNLQVISGLLYLQARRTRDQKLVEVLNESSNRVKSVALIHQRLQQSKDTVSVELGEYIRDLTTVLLHSRGRDSAVVKLNLDLEKNVVIGIDTAVPCGLIVNELVSNSLKHAFPDNRGGKINISLHTDDADTITLVIGDDGVGLPEGLDVHKADTLGLQLAMSLAGQLDASIEVTSGEGGTEFVIRFRESAADGGRPPREAVHAGTAPGDRR
jgi:two-component sensor histidine kinase